jgi:hypothetical protein
MRTRILRLAATTGATALIVGIGALATAGTASAATTAHAVSIAAHHVDGDCWCPDMGPLPEGHPPLPMCEGEHHHDWDDNWDHGGIDIHGGILIGLGVVL